VFYLFFILLVSGHYYLDAANFGNLQDLQEDDFERQQVGEHGQCPLPCWSYMVSPSSYTFACINLNTYTLYTYRIGFMVSRIT
jgi:hypothetical protein